ncbi:MAG: tetraacyldisaccharide 4'-kinase [Prolixibacteraceae bacterium]|nr:tetraacyldisaccharide 4'-kinase [Prolixibacteraceae bacterium]MBN2774710.1 tetraacyldisaccharide 4'-kinase [Prolixibacteraceae bacterium]
MLKLVLYPFSAIYGIIIYFRNRLYDLKILRSVEFEQPVISVGNITVGGTGKTPHTEYLVSILKDKFKVATLSRGYKRKTRGFRLVNVDSTTYEVGDEPLQIKNKFPEVTVAVCENRVKGVDLLLNGDPESSADIVILDDAFQHRRITPGINILLVDYNRPIKKDTLLPAGRLREGSVQMRRANIIIVTKCPEEITPISRRIMQKNVFLKPYQSMYFTSILYGKIKPVFSYNEADPDIYEKKDYDVLLVTGIASSAGIKKHLQKFSNEVDELKFSDHYRYSEKDIVTIMNRFNNLKSEKKLIVTTEKDAMRFRDIKNLVQEFRHSLYSLPIKVKFLEKEGELFNQKMINYVGENKSNFSLHKRKNQSKT